MTVTLDGLIDILIGSVEYEPGYRIQGDIHGFSSLVNEWKDDYTNNATALARLNADGTDPEFATFKSHINGLNKAATLALEDVLILARLGIPGYDKAYVRSRFGLS